MVTLKCSSASSHLYKRPCPTIGRRVGPAVGNAFVKIDENGLLWILNDLDSAGRGRKGQEGEQEGRGGRSDEEEGATRRVKK